jgi:hypothetical protein
MMEKTGPKVAIAPKTDNDGFQLSSRERSLISSFRAMKGSAQGMLLDLAEQYKRTLPAEPVKLRLLTPGKGEA